MTESSRLGIEAELLEGLFGEGHDGVFGGELVEVGVDAGEQEAGPAVDIGSIAGCGRRGEGGEPEHVNGEVAL